MEGDRRHRQRIRQTKRLSASRTAVVHPVDAESLLDRHPGLIDAAWLEQDPNCGGADQDGHLQPEIEVSREHYRFPSRKDRTAQAFDGDVLRLHVRPSAVEDCY